jgi:hypothetical protein
MAFSQPDYGKPGYENQQEESSDCDPDLFHGSRGAVLSGLALLIERVSISIQMTGFPHSFLGSLQQLTIIDF